PAAEHPRQRAAAHQVFRPRERFARLSSIPHRAKNVLAGSRGRETDSRDRGTESLALRRRFVALRRRGDLRLLRESLPPPSAPCRRRSSVVRYQMAGAPSVLRRDEPSTPARIVDRSLLDFHHFEILQMPLTTAAKSARR